MSWVRVPLCWQGSITPLWQVAQLVEQKARHAAYNSFLARKFGALIQGLIGGLVDGFGPVQHEVRRPLLFGVTVLGFGYFFWRTEAGGSPQRTKPPDLSVS